MFEESHNGSIDRFWFENAKTGTALLTAAGPRYELYESMTGGESWSVKQISSTPLTLEMPASTTNTGRRLRADARNRSYNLETKDGGAWQRVASFLVEIGSCK
jgi:hypothetical protein